MLRRQPYDDEFYVDTQADYNDPNDNTVYAQVAVENYRRFWQTCGSFGVPFGSLLDAGCRNGVVLHEALRLAPVLNAQGIDLVPQFVATALASGLNVIEGDIHKMPYRDGQFDAVYCSQVLEHCPMPEQALAELFRVAKSALFVGVPMENEQDFGENPSHYVSTLDVHEWLDMFKPHAQEWRLVEAYMNVNNPYINVILLRRG